MKCKCGTEAQLKEFNTFSFHYCPACKDEVKESSIPKASSNMQQENKIDNSGVDDFGEPLNGVYMF